jgi:hypothetical protein
MADLQFAVDDRPTAVGIALSYAARLAVVAAFVFIGASKFSNNPRSDWVKIFERIGWGDWFRYFTGSVQVVGALLMVLRRTLTIGAFLLICTMIGAMIVDIFVVRAPGFALLPAILIGIIGATWFTGHYGTLGDK